MVILKPETNGCKGTLARLDDCNLVLKFFL